MTHFPATPETVRSLKEPLRRVRKGKPVILDRKNGKPLAALITPEDAALLERLIEEEEDRIDVEEANRVRAAIKAGTEKVIPWEEVEARLDRLKD